MVAMISKEDNEARLNQVSISNKKIADKIRGERIIHIIIVPIFDSNKILRYILGIGEDVTEETLSMKIDLLFSITRRDILDQLSIIANYLERAQARRPPGKRCRHFLIRLLNRSSPSGTRWRLSGRSRTSV